MSRNPFGVPLAKSSASSFVLRRLAVRVKEEVNDRLLVVLVAGRNGDNEDTDARIEHEAHHNVYKILDLDPGGEHTHHAIRRGSRVCESNVS